MFKLPAVVPQVEILEKERAEERKRYEAKRNLMLSDFAHDLRTPIMTIGGYVNAITDGMVKGEDSRSQHTGSGLGLSVVKQVMDMHGFDIHLKQPYGNYSKAFVLKFYECSIIDI